MSGQGLMHVVLAAQAGKITEEWTRNPSSSRMS